MLLQSRWTSWIVILIFLTLFLHLHVQPTLAISYAKPDGDQPCEPNGTCSGVASCDTHTHMCHCPMNGLAADGTFHGEAYTVGNVTILAPCAYYPRQVVDSWKCDLFMFHGILVSVILLVLSTLGAIRIWNAGRRVAMQLFAISHIFMYALFYFIHYARDPAATNRDYTESYLLSYSPDLFLIALHNATLCYLRDLTNEAREVRSAGRWTTIIIIGTIMTMELLLLFFGPNHSGQYFMIVAVFMGLSACYSTYLGRRLQRQLGNHMQPISRLSTKRTAKSVVAAAPVAAKLDTPPLVAMTAPRLGKIHTRITIAPIGGGIGVAAAVAAVGNGNNGAMNSDGTQALDQLASPTQQLPSQTPTGRVVGTSARSARMLLSPTITVGAPSGPNGGMEANDSKLPADDNESKLPSQSPNGAAVDGGDGKHLTVGEIAGIAALAASMSPNDYDNNGDMMSPIDGGAAVNGGDIATGGVHHHSIATLRTGGGSVGHTIMSGGAELQVAHTTLTNGNTGNNNNNNNNNDVLSSSAGGDSVMHVHDPQLLSSITGIKHSVRVHLPMGSLSSATVKNGTGGILSQRTQRTGDSTRRAAGGATSGDDGLQPDGADEACMALSQVNASLAAKQAAVTAMATTAGAGAVVRSSHHDTVMTATSAAAVKKSDTRKATTIRVAPSSTVDDAEALYDNIQRLDAQQQIRHRVWLFTTGSALCAIMDMIILLCGMAYMWEHRLYDRSLLVFTVWRTNQMIWVILLLKTFWPRNGYRGKPMSGVPAPTVRIPLLKRATMTAGRFKAAVRAAMPRSPLSPTPAQRQAYAADLALGAGGSSAAGAHYIGQIAGNGVTPFGNANPYATAAAMQMANYHAPQQYLAQQYQHASFYPYAPQASRLPVTVPVPIPMMLTDAHGIPSSSFAAGMMMDAPHITNLMMNPSASPAQMKVEAWMYQNVDHNQQTLATQHMLHQQYHVAAQAAAVRIAAVMAQQAQAHAQQQQQQQGLQSQQPQQQQPATDGVDVYKSMPEAPRRRPDQQQLPGMMDQQSHDDSRDSGLHDSKDDGKGDSDDDLPTHRVLTRERPPLTLLPPIPPSMLQSPMITLYDINHVATAVVPAPLAPVAAAPVTLTAPTPPATGGGNSLVLFSQSPSLTPSSHLFAPNGAVAGGDGDRNMAFSASSNHSGVHSSGGGSPSGSPLAAHQRTLSPPQLAAQRRAMLPMAPSNSRVSSYESLSPPHYQPQHMQQPLQQQQQQQPAVRAQLIISSLPQTSRRLSAVRATSAAVGATGNGGAMIASHHHTMLS